MTALWHLLLLGVATCCLGAAALRCCCRLTTSPEARILGAAAFAAGAAITEAVLLGLASLGANPFALTGAAVLTWLAARWLVAAPDVILRRQLADAWAAAGQVTHATFGAVTAFIIGVSVWELWRPTFGQDGLSNHVAQPAVWIGNGRPGTLHQTVNTFPSQPYPKNLEVLVGWVISIGRSALATVPLTMGLTVLAIVAVVTGLRRLNVHPVIVALTIGGGLLVGVNLLETNGVWSDLPALAWLACAGALCVFSQREPGAVVGAAVAAGVAIGTKPTTAPLALIALGGALWVNREWIRGRLVPLAPAGILAAALGGVWYVQNWIVYGAPLWPFSRFPDGRPTPSAYTTIGAKFIDHPVASLKIAGLHDLAKFIGGGFIVIPGIALVAALTLLPGYRAHRKIAVTGFVITAVEVLFWSITKFTGITHGTSLLVLIGFRYLIPGPLAAAVTLALLTRSRGAIATISAAILGIATALNLYEARRQYFNGTLRHDLAIDVALLAAGVVLGLLAGQTSWAPRLIPKARLAPALTIVVAAAIAIPMSSYVSHYLIESRVTQLSDAPALTFLRLQPGWVHGHAPIAAGPEAAASFAGPEFTHPLSWISDGESCAKIRAEAKVGWVLLQPTPGDPYAKETSFERAPTCMAGIIPAAMIGKLKIYAPLRLLAHPG